MGRKPKEFHTSKTFRPHPGYEFRVVTPGELDSVRETGFLSRRSGCVGEITFEPEEGDIAQEPFTQKLVLVTREAGPEIVAHEIGHVATESLSKYDVPSSDRPSYGTPRGYVRSELEAWLWAEGKRGRIKRDYLWDIGAGLVSDYKLSPRKAVKLLESELKRHEWHLDPRDIPGMIEDLEGLEE